MNAIIYFGTLTLAFFLQDVHAQAPKLERSEKDVTAVTNYLIASEAGKDATFPLNLKNQDIFVYSFMSGVHKVMHRGGDSVLLVNLHTNDDPKGSRGVIFQFTVEPKLTRLEHEQVDKDWKELLTGRRVTQFHIQEVRKADGKTTYKDLHLVINRRE